MAQGLVADALGYVWDKLLTAALTAVFTASFLGLTLRGALFTRPGRLLFKCCVGFKYTILVFMVDDKANEGVFRKVMILVDETINGCCLKCSCMPKWWFQPAELCDLCATLCGVLPRVNGYRRKRVVEILLPCLQNGKTGGGVAKTILTFFSAKPQQESWPSDVSRLLVHSCVRLISLRGYIVSLPVPEARSGCCRTCKLPPTAGERQDKTSEKLFVMMRKAMQSCDWTSEDLEIETELVTNLLTSSSWLLTSALDTMTVYVRARCIEAVWDLAWRVGFDMMNSARDFLVTIVSTRVDDWEPQDFSTRPGFSDPFWYFKGIQVKILDKYPTILSREGVSGQQSSPPPPPRPPSRLNRRVHPDTVDETSRNPRDAGGASQAPFALCAQSDTPDPVQSAHSFLGPYHIAGATLWPSDFTT